jgi:hypothetical protein
VHAVKYGEGSGGLAGNVDLGRCKVLDHDARRAEVGFGMLWSLFEGCDDVNAGVGDFWVKLIFPISHLISR